MAQQQDKPISPEDPLSLRGGMRETWRNGWKSSPLAVQEAAQSREKAFLRDAERFFRLRYQRKLEAFFRPRSPLMKAWERQARHMAIDQETQEALVQEAASAALEKLFSFSPSKGALVNYLATVGQRAMYDASAQQSGLSPLGRKLAALEKASQGEAVEPWSIAAYVGLLTQREVALIKAGKADDALRKKGKAALQKLQENAPPKILQGLAMEEMEGEASSEDEGGVCDDPASLVKRLGLQSAVERTFLAYLLNECEEKGQTQEQIAKTLGISRATYNRHLETGKIALKGWLAKEAEGG